MNYVNRLRRESGGRISTSCCSCVAVNRSLVSARSGRIAVAESGQRTCRMTDTSMIVGILAAVGCVLILWLLADSLWTLFQGVKAHLLPYFQPTSVDLTEKFGSWAG
jgi:uncharacterized membrane protein YdbT with pleckstrin-like domain